MALYLFVHPITGETKEVVQAMNDEHVYIDEHGVKWNREFTKPTAAVDTKINPFDSKDFVEKTRNKRGTVGDLFDQSKDLSIQRQDKDGVDKISEKHMADWSKRRKGKLHPEVRKKHSLEKLKNMGVSVED